MVLKVRLAGGEEIPGGDLAGMILKVLQKACTTSGGKDKG
jgi:hypothetical protein